MKSILLKTITLILFVFIFFYLIPSKSVVFGTWCMCKGRYCFSGCSWASCPGNQYAWSRISGGVHGSCSDSSSCHYGNLALIPAGCSSGSWNNTVRCSSCTGGYLDYDSGQWSTTGNYCLDYNVCSGGPTPTSPPAVNNPKGYHDGSNCTASYGWTCDADNYATALTVKFYTDLAKTNYVGETIANGAREPAVATECGGNAYHGFTFTTPDSLKDGVPHELFAYAINIGSGSDRYLTLSGTTKTITCTPTCTVDLLPNSASISLGSGASFVASVVPSNGLVSQVNFSSGNTGIATVSPASDTTPSYQTTATGVGVGSANITANVIMGGLSRCSDSANVTVIPPGPWWQVVDSDVSTGGNLVSPIPSSCSLPSCNPVFGLKGAGGYPGVPLYDGSTADFQSGSGTGRAAEDPNNWLVNSGYGGQSYGFDYFTRQIPSDVTINEIDESSINGGYFNSNGNPSRGYVWFHYNGVTLGDLIVSGNVNINVSRRVVLLVEGADLHLDGRINIQSPGNGFFMAVVGKNSSGQKGNIYIDSNLSHPDQPVLEGIYFAENTIYTGAGTGRLYVRGSFVGLDGIDLERDLTDNSTTPAETFEYAPEIMSVFPQVFTSRRMRWKEVAP